jgi:hypothetical protein
MTKHLFGLAFIVVALVGCHPALGPYRNMDKWLLLSGEDRRPLSGHPRQITEYTYKAEDTSKPGWKRVFYIKYGLNAAGDIVSRDTYMEDTVVMKSETHFDVNGWQQTTTNVKSGQSSKVVTRPLGDGHFETINYHLKSKPTASVTSFPANGQEEIRDDYDDTVIDKKAPRSVHIYYDGNRIMRITGQTEAGTFEERLFYSRWDTPDSVRIYGGKPSESKLLERGKYFINDHGDPIRHITITGNVASAIESFRYVYDQKGNWIRQIQTAVSNAPGSSDTTNRAVVTDREIVY